MAANGRLTDELDRMWEEMIVTSFRVYPEIYRDWMKNTTGTSASVAGSRVDTGTEKNNAFWMQT